MRRKFDAMCRQYEVKTANGNGHAEWTDGLKSGFPSVTMFGATYQAASPTQDTPQEVVASNARVQSFGKNLFDINNLTAFAAQATRYTIADNKLTLTSYSQSNKWHQIRFYVNSFDALLHVGKQITWSFDAEEMLSEYRYQPTVNGYNASKARISSTHINFSGAEAGRKSITYTIPENCRYIGIEFQAPLTTEDFGEKIVGVFSNMQIELGSIATAYEPYHNGGKAVAPTLYAIGEYRDEWNPQTGKGFRRIRKIVWGTDAKGMYASSFTANRFMGVFTISGNWEPYPDGGLVGVPTMTNWGNDAAWVDSPDIFYFETAGESGFIRAAIGNNYSGVVYGEDTTYAARDKVVAWLNAKLAEGNPLEIYYVLAKPVPFQTDPMPLTCPTGYGQIIQLDGNIPNCPLEVNYLAHGGNKA